MDKIFFFHGWAGPYRVQIARIESAREVYMWRLRDPRWFLFVLYATWTLIVAVGRRIIPAFPTEVGFAWLVLSMLGVADAGSVFGHGDIGLVACAFVLTVATRLLKNWYFWLLYRFPTLNALVLFSVAVATQEELELGPVFFVVVVILLVVVLPDWTSSGTTRFVLALAVLTALLTIFGPSWVIPALAVTGAIGAVVVEVWVSRTSLPAMGGGDSMGGVDSLGEPVPPLLSSAARLLGTLAAPMLVYTTLGQYLFDSDSVSLAATGFVLGVTTMGAAIVGAAHAYWTGLLFPCATAIPAPDGVDASAGDRVVLGGRGNQLFWGQVEGGRLTNLRVNSAGSGIDLVISAIDGPEERLNWPMRLTPGLVLAVCPLVRGAASGLVASGGTEGRVHLWDLTSGKWRGALPGTGYSVRAICELADLGGHAQLAISDNWQIAVRNAMTGEVRWRVKAGGIQSMIADVENDLVLTGDTSGALTAWDADTGQRRYQVQVHRGLVSDLAPVQLDGLDCVATCGIDGHIAITERHAGRTIRTWRAAPHALWAICAVAIESRIYICVGGNGPETTLWDPINGSQVGEISLFSFLLTPIKSGWYQHLTTVSTPEGDMIIGAGKYNRGVTIMNPQKAVKPEPGY
ncbi:MAG: WD40 repeat domain-containing protein [Nocardioides sp.]